MKLYFIKNTSYSMRRATDKGIMMKKARIIAEKISA
jgi:hypothetical protein